MNAKELLIYQAYAGETSGSSEPSVTVEPLEVTENGEYTAPEGTAYSPVTVDVPTGGGGVSEDDDVLFIDYDGTLLYSYSADEFLALTEMPANPSHEGLVAQGWNWSLADAQEYVRDSGMQVIGQMYTTESGATEIDIVLGDERKTPYLGVRVNGSLIVEWGDGSAVETVTGTSITSTKKVPHEYATAGAYTIKISGPGLNLGAASNAGADILTCGINGQTGLDDYYRSRVRAIRLGPGTTIQAVAFSKLKDVEYITIPADVTITSAAYNTYASTLSSLAAIVLPPTESYLGNSAFSNCNQMRFISVPPTVQNLASSAFSGCHSLIAFACQPSVTAIGDSVFYETPELRRVALPNGLTSIASNAFSGTKALRHVALPETLTSIGRAAFSQSGIHEVVIPEGVTSFQTGVFSYCQELETCTLNPNLTTLPQDTFNNCIDLKDVLLPETITVIGPSAFGNCTLLENINIPSGVTELQTSAFSSATTITKIVLPNTLSSIQNNALANLSALAVLRFEASTPPTVANSNAFTGLPTDCIIEVPAGTLSAYTSAANYPSASTYTYREFTA